MCDCARAASGSRRTSRRVPGTAVPVFRLREDGTVRAARHLAVEMLGGRRPEGARMLGGPGPTRWHASTSCPATGGACAPATCMGAPTGR